ncbi:MAG TPA: tRNA lysidine(34) synthetase TilS [Casimicrobiaceae bacterium]|jgi:tRNA(Ile)-lysidine synthase
MASSRRSPPAEIEAAVAAALDRHCAGAPALIVALSGGRDSVVLLDVTAPLCAARGIALMAAHVHHGLSPHADAWAAFCEALCRRHGVAFALSRVEVRGAAADGIEAAARAARYAALAAMARASGAAHVALAHHADDQAETVLLQLARGAGLAGLAAMPALRMAGGIAWMRPLLDVPRAAIDAYAAARALAYVDDDSNGSMRHRRNALRRDVVPAFTAIAPGYPRTLVRAAAQAAEAARLADDLAAIDAGDAFDGVTLSRAALAALAPHRARNLLRHFLRMQGLRPPSSARLAAMLAQLADAAPDARVALRHDGAVIGIHAGRVVVHAPPPAPFDLAWHGEAALDLPHGTLAFNPEDAATMRLARPAAARGEWRVRARRGGERLKLDAAGPRRSLTSLLQRSGMPVWERDALPLVFCGDVLAAVPGIGVDPAFRAPAGVQGLVVRWHAHPRAA